MTYAIDLAAVDQRARANVLTYIGLALELAPSLDQQAVVNLLFDARFQYGAALSQIERTAALLLKAALDVFTAKIAAVFELKARLIRACLRNGNFNEAAEIVVTLVNSITVTGEPLSQIAREVLMDQLVCRLVDEAMQTAAA